jgi:valyl-tRNA synthetase
MITMGLEFTGKAPFKDVYIHGLIRDEKGQKMSKSKGNTIDPVQIIDKYGCDALRFTMTSLCTYGGQDIKISDERFEYGRNFANKLWNASRFVLMNLEGVDDKPIDKDKLTLVDKWILNQLNETAKLVNENMKEYRIGEIAHTLYDFFRSEYCDWYVEIAKIQLQDSELKLNTQRVLRYVLDMSLRMLHPIMPHITEYVWQLMQGKKETSALIIAEYPIYKEELSYSKEAEEMKMVFDTITSLRNVRQSFNISTSATVDVEIRAEGREKEIFNSIESYIHRLAKVNNITYENPDAPIPPKSATAVVSTSKLIVPLADLIDLDAEVKRQEKKLEKLTNEKNSLQGRMKNEKFVANAPKELVEQTNARIEEITAQEDVIKKLIESLKG